MNEEYVHEVQEHHSFRPLVEHSSKHPQLSIFEHAEQSACTSEPWVLSPSEQSADRPSFVELPQDLDFDVQNRDSWLVAAKVCAAGNSPMVAGAVQDMFGPEDSEPPFRLKLEEDGLSLGQLEKIQNYSSQHHFAMLPNNFRYWSWLYKKYRNSHRRAGAQDDKESLLSQIQGFILRVREHFGRTALVDPPPRFNPEQIESWRVLNSSTIPDPLKPVFCKEGCLEARKGVCPISSTLLNTMVVLKLYYLASSTEARMKSERRKKYQDKVYCEVFTTDDFPGLRLSAQQKFSGDISDSAVLSYMKKFPEVEEVIKAYQAIRPKTKQKVGMEEEEFVDIQILTVKLVHDLIVSEAASTMLEEFKRIAKLQKSAREKLQDPAYVAHLVSTQNPSEFYATFAAVQEGHMHDLPDILLFCLHFLFIVNKRLNNKYKKDPALTEEERVEYESIKSNIENFINDTVELLGEITYENQSIHFEIGQIETYYNQELEFKPQDLVLRLEPEQEGGPLKLSLSLEPAKSVPQSQDALGKRKKSPDQLQTEPKLRKPTGELAKPCFEGTAAPKQEEKPSSPSKSSVQPCFQRSQDFLDFKEKQLSLPPPRYQRCVGQYQNSDKSVSFKSVNSRFIGSRASELNGPAQSQVESPIKPNRRSLEDFQASKLVETSLSSTARQPEAGEPPGKAVDLVDKSEFRPAQDEQLIPEEFPQEMMTELEALVYLQSLGFSSSYSEAKCNKHKPVSTYSNPQTCFTRLSELPSNF